MLTVPKTPSCSLCVWTVSMRTHSKDFPETEVKMIGLLEDGCDIFHFESLEMSFGV